MEIPFKGAELDHVFRFSLLCDARDQNHAEGNLVELKQMPTAP